MRQITSDDFAFIARLLHRRSGLVLTPDKSGLLMRHVGPVLYRFGFKDLGQMMGELRLGNDSLAGALAEAVTVSDTWFWRGPEQFETLKTMLPALLAARAPARRLRIWSAACATGQEAWCLAMLMDEMALAEKGWTIDLIASDLSGEALARAEAGRYSAEETIRGLTPQMVERHFTRQGDVFTVRERLRRMVHFRRFNLLDSFGWLDELDLVLCRNVLIYFDRATKASVLERIAEAMAETGLLLLGEGESAAGLTRAFREQPRHSHIYGKSRQVLLKAAG